jgi:hypothetical protein
MSAEDVEKGARWNSDIARQLNGTTVGIICLTPENLTSPWILFEAGALSKTLESTFVCPYLLGVEPSDLKGPLVQFQSTRAEKEDTRRLMNTINSALRDGALPERRINEAYGVWWPRLEQNLKSISDRRATSVQPPRSDRDILEEVLELMRDMARGRLGGAQRPEFLGPDVRSPEALAKAFRRSLEEATTLIEAPSVAPTRGKAEPARSHRGKKC